MLLAYRKLAHVAADVATGVTTAAAIHASTTSGELMVVNVNGRMLTATDVAAHLAGTVNGETIGWVT